MENPLLITTLDPADIEWNRLARDLWLRFNIDQLALFSVPLTIQFRSVTSRTGLLLHGSEGWAECAPFSEYQPSEAATWLCGALSDASLPAPAPRRDLVPVNVTIPVQDPAAAAQRAQSSGCKTAKVKVADPRCTDADDLARVEAVAAALYENFGAEAKVRIDVNGAWTLAQAAELIPRFDAVCQPVGGLEYAEQPCMDVYDLAKLRRLTDVKIAADESIRRSSDPQLVRELEAADLVVIKVSPLGGVRRALALLEELQMPAVVSSAIDTSIGLATGVQLAASLESLPFACGLDTRRLLAKDVVARQMVTRGGALAVSDVSPVRNQDLCSGLPLESATVSGWVERVNQMAVFAGKQLDEQGGER